MKFSINRYFTIQNPELPQKILTASEIASRCNAWSLRANSVYLILNHPLKFGDLKNFLYNPIQSPLIPVVNCGPADSKVAIKSSGLKGKGVGAACQILKQLQFRFI